MASVITVKIQPRSSRDAVIGFYGDSIKICLKAPPVDGKANEALLSFLAGKLSIPKSGIRILSGQTARMKRVEIETLGNDEIIRRLQK